MAIISLADLNEFLRDVVKDVLEEEENKKKEEKITYTQDQVERILKVSSTTLYRWHKNGYLSHQKVGQRNVYLKSDVDKLIRKEM